MHTHYCPCTPGRLWPNPHDHTIAPVIAWQGKRGDDDPVHLAYVTATYNEDGTRR